MAGLSDFLQSIGYGLYDDIRRGELGKINGPRGTSTELSITVNDPRLMNGAPTNVPLLVKGQTGLASLLMGAEPNQDQYEIAIMRAIERLKSGGYLPTFNSINDATRAAENRSLEDKMSPYFREWR